MISAWFQFNFYSFRSFSIVRLKRLYPCHIFSSWTWQRERTDELVEINVWLGKKKIEKIEQASDQERTNYTRNWRILVSHLKNLQSPKTMLFLHNNPFPRFLKTHLTSSTFYRTQILIQSVNLTFTLVPNAPSLPLSSTFSEKTRDKW